MARMQFTVRAGNHARRHCPVWVDGEGLDPSRDYVVVSDDSKEALPAQAVQTANGVRLAWILPALAANASQTFTLEEGTKGSLDSAVSTVFAGMRRRHGKYGLDVHLNGELFHHLSPRGETQ